MWIADMLAKLTAAGRRKVAAVTERTLTLATLAGLYISFGGMICTQVLAGGGSRLLAGAAFSLGLILVVLTGAELFTGNLMTLTVARVPRWRNWGLVYTGNLLGSLLALALMGAAGMPEAVAEVARGIAEAKAALPFEQAFAKGILCNVLVCLAVAMAAGAESTAGKVLAIVPPIAAFVALGFEHSVANMYLIPMGYLAGAEVTLVDMLANLLPVTLGNMVGGIGLGLALRKEF